jgi:hypothetical protein
MNNNMRRLYAISKMIDMNMFYSIDCRCTGIVLQGHYEREFVDRLKKRKFTGWKIGDDPSYIYGYRGNIEIVFT